MLRAPRFRIGVLLVAIASLLVGPSSPAKAQVGPVELEAVVIGNTDPDAFPAEHTLGVNRVSGPSRFGPAAFGITALVVCPGASSVSLAALGSPHPVTFWSDDDVTDGYGEISTTDDSRQFEGQDQVSLNTVRARIEETGRFHRLLGVVEVDLTLDVRVTGPAGNQICHDPRLPFRIIFELFPQTPDPTAPGFTLVGIGRRHITGTVDDRISVARTVCGLVAPRSTRVEEPPVVTPVRGPGRDDFHPCPPEGQQ